MPQIIGSFFSMAAFAALVLVWRGHTTFLESLLIFPVGLATGVAHSATFIGLGAGVEEEDIAIAGSGLYLSSNVGSVAGVSLGNAIYQSTLRRGLNRALEGSPYKEDVSFTLQGFIPAFFSFSCSQKQSHWTASYSLI